MLFPWESQRARSYGLDFYERSTIVQSAKGLGSQKSYQNQFTFAILWASIRTTERPDDHIHAFSILFHHFPKSNTFVFPPYSPFEAVFISHPNCRHSQNLCDCAQKVPHDEQARPAVAEAERQGRLGVGYGANASHFTAREYAAWCGVSAPRQSGRDAARFFLLRLLFCFVIPLSGLGPWRWRA
jgi:hypothetical protein